jgi:hypothetical protein
MLSHRLRHLGELALVLEQSQERVRLLADLGEEADAALGAAARHRALS